MTAKVMLLLLSLAIRNTEIFQVYGDKMDKQQIKYTMDLFLNTILQDFNALGRKILVSEDNEQEKIELEMADLVAYYEEIGILPAIRKHNPQMNPLFEALLEKKEINEKIRSK